jgi:hypothetical protein
MWFDAPSNALYAALSYVWGQPVKKEGALPTQQKYSRTILDAITVAKAIGLKYLWVDKYCIDQDDVSKKLQQINQMHLIYASAEITIIASDGANAEAGLPGVGSTSRNPQAAIDVDSITLISHMVSPRARISKSIWATRGWTLQEAVLSRRRLVFTAEQMYFECGVMNVSEDMWVHLDSAHTENKDEAREGIHAGIFSGHQDIYTTKRTGSTSDHLAKYRTLVKDYTARSLGYDEDSLKGFQGILNSLQNGNSEIENVWGLCFSDFRTFVRALSWYHVRDVHPTKKPYRRCLGEQEFDNTKMPLIPSWSWAGWRGKVEFAARGLSDTDVIEDGKWAKLGDNVVFPAPTTLPSNLRNDGFNQPVTLEFEAQVFPAEGVLSVTKTRFCFYEKNPMSWFLSYEFTDLDDLLLQFKQKRYEVITWLQSYPELGTILTWGLVIENHIGFSTRIGLVSDYCFIEEERLVKRVIKLR